MVDFRYHLVSILAVFLALAVGIVLGTTTINPEVIADLRGRVNNLTTSNAERRAENDALASELRDSRRFADEVLPVAVDGRLDGQRVTVVSAPGVPSRIRDGVVSVIERAGGTVGAHVALKDKLADPNAEAELDGLVASATPTAGIELPDGSAVRRLAAQLAHVLGTGTPTGTPDEQPATPSPSAAAAVTPAFEPTPTPTDTPSGSATPATPPESADTPTPAGTPTPTASPTGTPRPSVSPEEAAAVLAALEDAEVIAVDGDEPSTDVFVVIARIPPPESTAESRAAVHVVNEVVGALAETSRAVVTVAPTGGAAPGSVLDGLRTDAELSSRVSSVDNVDTAAGQVAMVYAIVERLGGGFGHYGAGSDAIPDINDES